MIQISKPIVGDEEIQGVNEVLRSGMLAQGPRVKELEEKFAQYCGAKHAIAMNSGTAAIHAGLYALDVKEGDEVITTPFTFVASANPILMLGAKVVFADISENDFNIDPEKIKEKITEKTRCILPVDLYGQICDSGKIKAIAEEHGLKIFEDACQAIGAEQDGKRAGSIFHAGAFSLYATKNIMCGEGGVVTTDDDEVAEKCRRFRHHGQSEKTRYEYWDLGYNYRLTDLQAAIAIPQLGRADQLNDKRIANAGKLSQGLSRIPGLILPGINPGNRHVFHQHTIRITEEAKFKREDLMSYLKEKGIGCGIYYPKPLHLHPHFAKFGYKEGDFPVAEKIAKEVLSLPVHPSLSDEDVNHIIETIRNYAS